MCPCPKSWMAVLYDIVTVPGYILMTIIFRNFLQHFLAQVPGRRYRPHLLILLSKVISLSTLQRLYIFFSLPRGVQTKRGRDLCSKPFLCSLAANVCICHPKAHFSPGREGRSLTPPYPVWKTPCQSSGPSTGEQVSWHCCTNQSSSWHTWKSQRNDVRNVACNLLPSGWLRKINLSQPKPGQ